MDYKDYADDVANRSVEIPLASELDHTYYQTTKLSSKSNNTIAKRHLSRDKLNWIIPLYLATRRLNHHAKHINATEILKNKMRLKRVARTIQPKGPVSKSVKNEKSKFIPRSSRKTKARMEHKQHLDKKDLTSSILANDESKESAIAKDLRTFLFKVTVMIPAFDGQSNELATPTLMREDRSQTEMTAASVGPFASSKEPVSFSPKNQVNPEPVFATTKINPKESSAKSESTTPQITEIKTSVGAIQSNTDVKDMSNFFVELLSNLEEGGCTSKIGDHSTNLKDSIKNQFHKLEETTQRTTTEMASKSSKIIEEKKDELLRIPYIGEIVVPIKHNGHTQTVLTTQPLPNKYITNKISPKDSILNNVNTTSQRTRENSSAGKIQESNNLKNEKATSSKSVSLSEEEIDLWDIFDGPSTQLNRNAKGANYNTNIASTSKSDSQKLYEHSENKREPDGAVDSRNGKTTVFIPISTEIVRNSEHVLDENDEKVENIGKQTPIIMIPTVDQSKIKTEENSETVPFITENNNEAKHQTQTDVQDKNELATIKDSATSGRLVLTSTKIQEITKNAENTNVFIKQDDETKEEINKETIEEQSFSTNLYQNTEEKPVADVSRETDENNTFENQQFLTTQETNVENQETSSGEEITNNEQIFITESNQSDRSGTNEIEDTVFISETNINEPTNEDLVKASEMSVTKENELNDEENQTNELLTGSESKTNFIEESNNDVTSEETPKTSVALPYLSKTEETETGRNEGLTSGTSADEELTTYFVEEESQDITSEEVPRTSAVIPQLPENDETEVEPKSKQGSEIPGEQDEHTRLEVEEQASEMPGQKDERTTFVIEQEASEVAGEPKEHTTFVIEQTSDEEITDENAIQSSAILPIITTEQESENSEEVTKETQVEKIDQTSGESLLQKESASVGNNALEQESEEPVEEESQNVQGINDNELQVTESSGVINLSINSETGAEETGEHNENQMTTMFVMQGQSEEDFEMVSSGIKEQLTNINEPTHKIPEKYQNHKNGRNVYNTKDKVPETKQLISGYGSKALEVAKNKHRSAQSTRKDISTKATGSFNTQGPERMLSIKENKKIHKSNYGSKKTKENYMKIITKDFKEDAKVKPFQITESINKSFIADITTKQTTKGITPMRIHGIHSKIQITGESAPKGTLVKINQKITTRINKATTSANRLISQSKNDHHLKDTSNFKHHNSAETTDKNLRHVKHFKTPLYTTTLRKTSTSVKYHPKAKEKHPIIKKIFGHTSQITSHKHRIASAHAGKVVTQIHPLNIEDEIEKSIRTTTTTQESHVHSAEEQFLTDSPSVTYDNDVRTHATNDFTNDFPSTPKCNKYSHQPINTGRLARDFLSEDKIKSLVDNKVRDGDLARVLKSITESNDKQISGVTDVTCELCSATIEEPNARIMENITEGGEERKLLGFTNQITEVTCELCNETLPKDSEMKIFQRITEGTNDKDLLGFKAAPGTDVTCELCKETYPEEPQTTKSVLLALPTEIGDDLVGSGFRHHQQSKLTIDEDTITNKMTTVKPSKTTKLQLTSKPIMSQSEALVEKFSSTSNKNINGYTEESVTNLKVEIENQPKHSPTSLNSPTTSTYPQITSVYTKQSTREHQTRTDPSHMITETKATPTNGKLSSEETTVSHQQANPTSTGFVESKHKPDTNLQAKTSLSAVLTPRSTEAKSKITVENAKTETENFALGKPSSTLTERLEQGGEFDVRTTASQVSEAEYKTTPEIIRAQGENIALEESPSSKHAATKPTEALEKEDESNELGTTSKKTDSEFKPSEKERLEDTISTGLEASSHITHAAIESTKSFERNHETGSLKTTFKLTQMQTTGGQEKIQEHAQNNVLKIPNSNADSESGRGKTYETTKTQVKTTEEEPFQKTTVSRKLTSSAHIQNTFTESSAKHHTLSLPRTSSKITESQPETTEKKILQHLGTTALETSGYHTKPVVTTTESFHRQETGDVHGENGITEEKSKTLEEKLIAHTENTILQKLSSNAHALSASSESFNKQKSDKQGSTYRVTEEKPRTTKEKTMIATETATLKEAGSNTHGSTGYPESKSKFIGHRITTEVALPDSETTEEKIIRSTESISLNRLSDNAHVTTASSQPLFQEYKSQKLKTTPKINKGQQTATEEATKVHRKSTASANLLSTSRAVESTEFFGKKHTSDKIVTAFKVTEAKPEATDEEIKKHTENVSEPTEYSETSKTAKVYKITTASKETGSGKHVTNASTDLSKSKQEPERLETTSDYVVTGKTTQTKNFALDRPSFSSHGVTKATESLERDHESFEPETTYKVTRSDKILEQSENTALRKLGSNTHAEISVTEHLEPNHETHAIKTTATVSKTKYKTTGEEIKTHGENTSFPNKLSSSYAGITTTNYENRHATDKIKTTYKVTNLEPKVTEEDKVKHNKNEVLEESSVSPHALTASTDLYQERYESGSTKTRLTQAEHERTKIMAKTHTQSTAFEKLSSSIPVIIASAKSSGNEYETNARGTSSRTSEEIMKIRPDNTISDRFSSNRPAATTLSKSYEGAGSKHYQSTTPKLLESTYKVTEAKQKTINTEKSISEEENVHDPDNTSEAAEITSYLEHKTTMISTHQLQDASEKAFGATNKITEEHTTKKDNRKQEETTSDIRPVTEVENQVVNETTETSETSEKPEKAHLTTHERTEHNFVSLSQLHTVTSAKHSTISPGRQTNLDTDQETATDYETTSKSPKDDEVAAPSEESGHNSSAHSLDEKSSSKFAQETESTEIFYEKGSSKNQSLKTTLALGTDNSIQTGSTNEENISSDKENPQILHDSTYSQVETASVEEERILHKTTDITGQADKSTEKENEDKQKETGNINRSTNMENEEAEKTEINQTTHTAESLEEFKEFDSESQAYSTTIRRNEPTLLYLSRISIATPRKHTTIPPEQANALVTNHEATTIYSVLNSEPSATRELKVPEETKEEVSEKKPNGEEMLGFTQETENTENNTEESGEESYTEITVNSEVQNTAPQKTTEEKGTVSPTEDLNHSSYNFAESKVSTANVQKAETSHESTKTKTSEKLLTTLSENDELKKVYSSSLVTSNEKNTKATGQVPVEEEESEQYLTNEIGMTQQQEKEEAMLSTTSEQIASTQKTEEAKFTNLEEETAMLNKKLTTAESKTEGITKETGSSWEPTSNKNGHKTSQAKQEKPTATEETYKERESEQSVTNKIKTTLQLKEEQAMSAPYSEQTSTVLANEKDNTASKITGLEEITSEENKIGFSQEATLKEKGNEIYAFTSETETGKSVTDEEIDQEEESEQAPANEIKTTQELEEKSAMSSTYSEQILLTQEKEEVNTASKISEPEEKTTLLHKQLESETEMSEEIKSSQEPTSNKNSFEAYFSTSQVESEKPTTAKVTYKEYESEQSPTNKMETTQQLEEKTMSSTKSEQISAMQANEDNETASKVTELIEKTTMLQKKLTSSESVTEINKEIKSSMEPTSNKNSHKPYASALQTEPEKSFSVTDLQTQISRQSTEYENQNVLHLTTENEAEEISTEEMPTAYSITSQSGVVPSTENAHTQKVTEQETILPVNYSKETTAHSTNNKNILTVEHTTTESEKDDNNVTKENSETEITEIEPSNTDKTPLLHGETAKGELNVTASSGIKNNQLFLTSASEKSTARHQKSTNEMKESTGYMWTSQESSQNAKDVSYDATSNLETKTFESAFSHTENPRASTKESSQFAVNTKTSEDTNTVDTKPYERVFSTESDGSEGKEITQQVSNLHSLVTETKVLLSTTLADFQEETVPSKATLKDEPKVSPKPGIEEEPLFPTGALKTETTENSGTNKVGENQKDQLFTTMEPLASANQNYKDISLSKANGHTGENEAFSSTLNVGTEGTKGTILTSNIAEIGHTILTTFRPKTDINGFTSTKSSIKEYQTTLATYNLKHLTESLSTTHENLITEKYITTDYIPGKGANKTNEESFQSVVAHTHVTSEGKLKPSTKKSTDTNENDEQTTLQNPTGHKETTSHREATEESEFKATSQSMKSSLQSMKSSSKYKTSEKMFLPHKTTMQANEISNPESSFNRKQTTNSAVNGLKPETSEKIMTVHTTSLESEELASTGATHHLSATERKLTNSAGTLAPTVESNEDILTVSHVTGDEHHSRTKQHTFEERLSTKYTNAPEGSAKTSVPHKQTVKEEAEVLPISGVHQEPLFPTGAIKTETTEEMTGTNENNKFSHHSTFKGGIVSASTTKDKELTMHNQRTNTEPTHHHTLGTNLAENEKQEPTDKMHTTSIHKTEVNELHSSETVYKVKSTATTPMYSSGGGGPISHTVESENTDKSILNNVSPQNENEEESTERLLTTPIQTTGINQFSSTNSINAETPEVTHHENVVTEENATSNHFTETEGQNTNEGNTQVNNVGKTTPEDLSLPKHTVTRTPPSLETDGSILSHTDSLKTEVTRKVTDSNENDEFVTSNENKETGNQNSKQMPSSFGHSTGMSGYPTEENKTPEENKPTQKHMTTEKVTEMNHQTTEHMTHVEENSEINSVSPRETVKAETTGSDITAEESSEYSMESEDENETEEEITGTELTETTLKGTMGFSTESSGNILTEAHITEEKGTAAEQLTTEEAANKAEETSEINVGSSKESMEKVTSSPVTLEEFSVHSTEVSQKQSVAQEEILQSSNYKQHTTLKNILHPLAFFTENGTAEVHTTETITENGRLASDKQATHVSGTSEKMSVPLKHTLREETMGSPASSIEEAIFPTAKSTDNYDTDKAETSKGVKSAVENTTAPPVSAVEDQEYFAHTEILKVISNGETEPDKKTTLEEKLGSQATLHSQGQSVVSLEKVSSILPTTSLNERSFKTSEIYSSFETSNEIKITTELTRNEFTLSTKPATKSLLSTVAMTPVAPSTTTSSVSTKKAVHETDISTEVAQSDIIEVEKEILNLFTLTEHLTPQEIVISESTPIESTSKSHISEATSEHNNMYMKTSHADMSQATKQTPIPIYIELPVYPTNTSQSIEEFVKYYAKMFNESNYQYPSNQSDQGSFVILLEGLNPENLKKLNGTKWRPAGDKAVNQEVITEMPKFKVIFETTAKTTEASTVSSTTKTAEASQATNLTPSATTLHANVPINLANGQCSEEDVRNGNCFCSIDSVVDSLKTGLRNGQHNISLLHCPSFVKMQPELAISNSSVPLVRRKRSHLFLKTPDLNKEISDESEMEKFLAEEEDIHSTDKETLGLVGDNVSIPCIYLSDVQETTHIKYVWTAGQNQKPLQDGHVRDDDGSLDFNNVSIHDGGNYTCHLRTSLDKTYDKASYEHELHIVSTPVYKMETTRMYIMNESCTLKDCDTFYTYLPKILDELICGTNTKICKVELLRPTCVNQRFDHLINVTFTVIMYELQAITPVDSAVCSLKCQARIYSQITAMVLHNLEMVEKMPVRSSLDGKEIQFKPKVSNKTRESHIEFIIGCPPGFGIGKAFKKICFACPKNTYKSDDNSFCKMCPIGQYQPVIGSESCLTCLSPLDDSNCLQVLYENTGYFAVYVGIAFGVVVLILALILYMTKVYNEEEQYQSSINRRPPPEEMYMLRKRKHDVDLESETEPLVNKPRRHFKISASRSPPQVPPPDF